MAHMYGKFFQENIKSRARLAHSEGGIAATGQLHLHSTLLLLLSLLLPLFSPLYSCCSHLACAGVKFLGGRQKAVQ